MQPVKIFAPESHYAAEARGQLIDLLKPFWGKGQEFDDAQRVAMYGLSGHDVVFTSAPEACDWVVLPMSWNYYRTRGLMSSAHELLLQAAAAGKKVLSWTSGDFGVKVPHYDNLIVLRASGYRSRLPDYHQGMPVFFSDPLKRFYGREEIIRREKQEKPVVGFCGQAQGHWGKYAYDVARTAWRNAQFYAGLSHDEPQALYPSTLRRSRILDILERDVRIETNFIRRKQYRAGAQTPEARERSTREFYDNMLHSDYVICVRGGGNFSVRLYETLAMGRIPVFVNTDCLLPLADQIDWREHVVWVEEDNLSETAKIICDFHRSKTHLELEKIQKQNRILWNNKLKLDAFFKKYLRSLE